MLPFQTLSEFIYSPFGFSDEARKRKLESQYQHMKNKSSFKVVGYTIVDGNYFIRVTIPSDSNPKQTYDVVVLFFADDSVVKKRTTFSNYFVKFFSNSPSFIYKYAYVYKKNGFMIDFLYDKLDQNFINQAPTKTNANEDMFYDKSIYCACRLLEDDRMGILSKTGIIFRHKKNKDQFFREIQSFENVKLTNELRDVDKKIDKELKENKKITKKEKIGNKKVGGKVHAKSNTLGKGNPSVIRTVKKKSGGRKIGGHKSTKR